MDIKLAIFMPPIKIMASFLGLRFYYSICARASLPNYTETSTADVKGQMQRNFTLSKFVIKISSINY